MENQDNDQNPEIFFDNMLRQCFKALVDLKQIQSEQTYQNCFSRYLDAHLIVQDELNQNYDSKIDH